MASSLETNKVVAAILAAGIIASGSGVVSRILYHAETPEENAYPIAIVEGEGGAGEDVAEEVSVAALLPTADASEGESVAKKCAACHDFEEGGANKIGPALWGVLGRAVASASGFAYSDALAGIEGEWTYENLAEFLSDPKAYAPGTKMAFAGVRDHEDLADLILYLRSLGASEMPLPEAPAEEPAAEDSAAAEDTGAAPQEETSAEQLAEEEAADAAEGAETAAEAEAVTAADVAAATEEETGQDVAATESGTGQQQAVAGEEAAPAAQEDAEQQATAEAGAALGEAEPEVAAGEGESGDVETAVAALEEPTAAAEEAAAAGDEAGGIGALLAQADAEAGAKDARKCATCHSFEEGGRKKIGPPLWGVVGRDIASVEDFDYSNALAGKEGAWDYAALDAYIADPRDFAPGNKMAFAGVRKPEDRADLILYLRSLAEDPAPLP